MNHQAHLNHARKLYSIPLFELLHEAHSIHKKNFDPAKIQKCALLSIKTGGCTEDCKYCPQSAHYKTELKKEPLISIDDFKEKLLAAKSLGAERFCLGAAWKEVKDGEQFDRVLEMVRMIRTENMEACVTLGMLKASHAAKLKQAGLTAYNHNLDTSREFYPKIISTRTYDDRIETLKYISDAGISICSGGILGLGETIDDRLSLIAELASFNPQPESVPINLLVPVEGTPLVDQKCVDTVDFIKVIAIGRILLPRTRIRLSAGRAKLNNETQLLAFYAGANSIFFGEKLLTTENPDPSADFALLQQLL